MIRPALTICCLLTGLFCSGSGMAGESIPLEASGKRLYWEGATSGGHGPRAFIGRNAFPVEGTAVPCVGCHGEDGLGRAEGGIVPPNITWLELTKPYGHRHKNGRNHPAFDRQSIIRAVVSGLDPAGHRLDSAMPRYRLSREEGDALIAYLKRLGNDAVPGVGDQEIRIGALLPVTGTSAIGPDIQNVLAGFFAEINAQGGIYRRKLILDVVDTGGTPAEALARVRGAIEGQGLFALIASLTPGIERETAEIVEKAEIPSIGPLNADGTDGLYTFRLSPNLLEQLRVLVDYAAQTYPKTPAAVLFSETSRPLDALAALDRQTAVNQMHAPLRVPIRSGEVNPEQLAADLRDKGIGVLYVLEPSGGLMALLNASAKLAWRPAIFLPNMPSGSDLSGFAGPSSPDVFLAPPSLPVDRQQDRLEKLRMWLGPGSGKARPITRADAAAYAAGAVVVEGIKRAGRDLSRRKLVTAIETLSDFETGLMPRFRFAPSQHSGSPGAYIVSFDLLTKQLRQVTKWTEPRPESR